MFSKDDDVFVDDFDLNLDGFDSFDDLFKEEKEEILITDFEDYLISKPSKGVYKDFNKKYEQYKKLSEILTPSKEEKQELVLLGEELAILVAKDFDFSDEEISNRKKQYVEFARERLVEASKKPYYRELAMLFYIKALYGQTNLAFSHEGTNKKKNIDLGNDYVTRLERYTDDRALKGYVLALRAYRLLIDWNLLELPIETRQKKILNELLYATKWDDHNYLAEYALGLLYLNEAWDTYDVDKAKVQFEIVSKLDGVKVPLDKYINIEEKERIIKLAQNKLKELK